MNQKSILFLFLLCIGSLTGFSQIVSTESFDAVTFPPAGWSIKPVITPQNPWRRQTSPATNPTAAPHSGASMARFARNFTAGTKQILVSRAVDYTLRGTNNANLDFWIYRDIAVTSDTDSIRVFVNSTDTLDATAVYLGTIARNRMIAIPDTQASNGWYHYTYAIPASFTGNATSRFIFEGTSDLGTAGAGQNIFIDDISFDEFPNVCSGTPNVGNIVNNNPLICGGSGSASLSVASPITGVLGITYSWQEASSSAGPWTNIGTNSSTLTIPTISASTFYQCSVFCSYSALTYTTPIDSIIVSTNPLPTVVATPTNAVLCAGSTGVTISATGAASYTWSPATGLNTNTGDTVIASPTVATQYIVTGVDSAGCSNTATVNVTLNAGPAVSITATPNDTACTGTQIILNSLPGGGATGNIYLWSDGVTTRRDTIIVTATTTYSVVVTNAAGCSNSDSITIVATPASVADFIFTNAGNTYTFTDASTAASSWTWTFGDGNGSSNQNPVYTYSTPGTYTVTLIISGTGCNDDTITKVIVVGPESLNETELSSLITYYPNPVQDQLVVSMNNNTIDAIIIHNSVGEKVFKQTFDSAEKSITVPTSGLSAGIYFAEIRVNGQLVPFKFVKQ